MTSSIDRDEVVVETTAPVPPNPAGVVVQPVSTVPLAATASVRSTWTHRFAPDAVVTTLAGVVLLLFGLVAVTRGGFAEPLSEPRVEVLGFGHTTVLGLIEIGFGLAFLAAGISLSRSGAVFFGSVLAIAAFVGAVQTRSFRTSLALESGFAWLMVLLGVVVLLGALTLPRVYARTTSVTRGYDVR